VLYYQHSNSIPSHSVSSPGRGVVVESRFIASYSRRTLYIVHANGSLLLLSREEQPTLSFWTLGTPRRQEPLRSRGGDRLRSPRRLFAAAIKLFPFGKRRESKGGIEVVESRFIASYSRPILYIVHANGSLLFYRIRRHILSSARELRSFSMFRMTIRISSSPSPRTRGEGWDGVRLFQSRAQNP
jgi:hypothetical protein